MSRGGLVIHGSGAQPPFKKNFFFHSNEMMDNLEVGALRRN